MPVTKIMQLLPGSCPYFIILQWTEPFCPGLTIVQDRYLSSHQHWAWLTSLNKAGTRTWYNPTLRKRSPSVFGSPLVLYWPDKWIPVSTAEQCICSSIQHLALFSLKSPLMLLPGKTLSGIRSVPVTTLAERLDFFANFTVEHVKLLSPLTVSAG